MIEVSFYHKNTGMLLDLKYSTTDKEGVALNTPPDHIAIEGHHDHLSKRVDLETGKVIEHRPDQPSDHHVWDDTIKRWKLGKERQAVIDRHKEALAKIAQLEALQPRYLREHALGTNSKALERLQAIEEEIVSLRKDIMP